MHVWVQPLVLAVVFVPIGLTATMWPWLRPFWLVVILVLVLEAAVMRSFGVDLTPTHAVLRGLRRRAVPWSEVADVATHGVLGHQAVQLVLRNGRRLTLRAPAVSYGIGVTEFEREHRRIVEWWLAQRGAVAPGQPPVT